MVSLWFSQYRDDEAVWQTVIKDPIVIVTVLFSYLYFVLKCGPEFMKNRQPYELRKVMLVYNAIQVVYNIVLSYMCFVAIVTAPLASNNWLCFMSTDRTLLCAYMYVFNKYMDMTDTVIFVLRKKKSQITFLHLFHHVVMIAWPALTLHLPGLTDGEATQGGLVNSLVHVIMYSYYFASIYGDRLRMITSFVKMHVTQIQLIQFVMLMVLFGRGTFGYCQYSYYFSAFAFYLNVVFLGLFLQMYMSFKKKAGSKSKPKA